MTDLDKLARPLTKAQRVGPHITIQGSCSGCAYERSVSYRCQSDSGHDVYCDHPAVGGRRVGDTRWVTPDWCPLTGSLLALRNHVMKENADDRD